MSNSFFQGGGEKFCRGAFAPLVTGLVINQRRVEKSAFENQSQENSV